MSFILKFIHDIGFYAWDLSLTVTNLILPSRPEDKVTPEGHPGFEGNWPEYIPPKDGDSRCCCPALNAMANHGILPRDGKNIQFKEMGRLIRSTYNFSSTFCYFVPNYAANFLHKDYAKDTFDLAELNLHSDKNGIEHDASICRQYRYVDPANNKPYAPYIKELLSYAWGKDKDGNHLLTIKDMGSFRVKRRADARASNPEFSLNFIHPSFGSTSSSLILTVFGGRVKDLLKYYHPVGNQESGSHLG